MTFVTMIVKKYYKKIFAYFFSFSFLFSFQVFSNVDILGGRNMKEEGYHPSHHGHWNDYTNDHEDSRAYVMGFTKKQAMAFVAYQLLKDDYLRHHLVNLGDFMLWKIVLYWSKKIEKALVHRAVVTAHQRYEGNATLFFLALKTIQQKMKDQQEEQNFQETMKKHKETIAHHENNISIMFFKKFHKKIIDIKNPIGFLP